MKRAILSLSLSLCTLSVVAFPSFEPFADSTASGGTSYASGATLAGQVNASGEGWVAIGTSATGASVVLTNGLLAAPINLPSSTGNMVQMVNQLGPGARYNFPSRTTGLVFYSV